jgi:four helix bundle protein
MSGAHRTILAWQKAMALVTEIYRETATFPSDERFGLTTQLRRAASSVPSNIAEGKGRFSKKEYVQYLYRARGSLLEVETQLEIAHNLAFVTDERFAKLTEQIDDAGKTLNGLIKSVEKQFL